MPSRPNPFEAAAREVPCPFCRATPGEHCKSTGRRQAPTAHWIRYHMARTAGLLPQLAPLAQHRAL